MSSSRIAFGVLLAALLSLPALAQTADLQASDPVQITALAVSQDSQGTFVGVHATVTAQVLAGGSGRVFVSTKPLAQTDMQGSARLASRVAATTLGATWSDYDYLVTFTSDSTVIGGPSAGGEMTVALTVALHNLRDPANKWTLDPHVAGTGTINPDGTIGPVGGIPAKAQGAKDAGITTFLYPAGLDNATTLVQGRNVLVDMQTHCASLGIACRPAATLAEFLEAEAGVHLQTAPAPVPGTTDYATLLSPSVQTSVNALQARLSAAGNDSRLSGLASVDRTRVQDELDSANERLSAAQDALSQGKYYLAATRSFQGAIGAGHVENLTNFDAARNQTNKEAVVTAALAQCQSAVDAAKAATDSLDADTLTALYAVASAQERAAQAQQLHDQAASDHDQARTYEDWIQSLFASTFCVERAGTANWWANLRTSFGPGPKVTDLDALVQDTLDEAQELVAYAQAVLGDSAVQDATTQLTSAQQHESAGHKDAAILDAIQAETAASVAMQTGGGSAVPQAVLDAAQQSAARAIASARSQGIEPMLSVSLVELAQDQNGSASALESLWNARSLALLQLAPAQVSFAQTTPPSPSNSAGTFGTDTVAAATVLGAVVGLAATGTLIAVVALIRRR